MTEDQDDATEYRIRVTQGVMSAVIAAGAIEGSGGGMVNLDVALLGISDAIAALVAAAGVDRTPKDRRDTADVCRRRILATSNALARLAEQGQPIPWSMERLSAKH